MQVRYSCVCTLRRQKSDEKLIEGNIDPTLDLFHGTKTVWPSPTPRKVITNLRCICFTLKSEFSLRTSQGYERFECFEHFRLSNASVYRHFFPYDSDIENGPTTERDKSLAGRSESVQSRAKSCKAAAASRRVWPDRRRSAENDERPAPRCAFIVVDRQPRRRKVKEAPRTLLTFYRWRRTARTAACGALRCWL